MPALALTEQSFQDILKASDEHRIKQFLTSIPTTDKDIRFKELAIVKMGEIYKLNKYPQSNKDLLTTWLT
jgi:ATP-dependent protease HslVU (ClpYQ) ATPase subunit